MVSKKYFITGKPDRIIKIGDKFIPIEYKSSSHASAQSGHILQLGAYFIIIEENFGSVPYGYLEYKDKLFKVKNDDNIKRKVIEKAIEVRENNYPHRNHNNPGKCIKCPFRDVCDLSLA